MNRGWILLAASAALISGCGSGGTPVVTPPRTATVSMAFPKTGLIDTNPIVTLPAFNRSLGQLKQVDVKIAVTMDAEVKATASGGASLSGDYSIRGFCGLVRTPGSLNLVDVPTTAGGTSGTINLGPGGTQTWTFGGTESIVTQQVTSHTRGSAFDAFNGGGDVTMTVQPKIVVSLPPGATSMTTGAAEGTVSVTYTYTPAFP